MMTIVGSTLEEPTGNPIEDIRIARARCAERENTPEGLFRTLNGTCNNLRNVFQGSKGSELPRIVPGAQERLDLPIFFDLPQNLGKIFRNMR